MNFGYQQPYGTGMRGMQFLTLGDLIEGMSYGTAGSTNDKIAFARPQIFNFEYDSISEEHKERLETLFLKQFYFNEIGFETEGRFLFELERWFQMNMPYYNKLLQSQVFEKEIKNPLHNYELTDETTNESSKKDNENSKVINNQDKIIDSNSKMDTKDQENSSTSKNAGGSTTKGLTESASENTNIDTDTTQESERDENSFKRDLTEETPQDRLVITTEDGEGIIEYASSIAESKLKNSSTDSTSGNSTTTGSATSTKSNSENGTYQNEESENSNSSKQGTANNVQKTSEKDTQTINEIKENNTNVKTTEKRYAFGSIGVRTYGELLEDYRTIFHNYDELILNAVQTELFMLVY